MTERDCRDRTTGPSSSIDSDLNPSLDLSTSVGGANSTRYRARTGRAVSTVVNYSIMLVVVGLLVSGLLIGVDGHVTDQNERVIEAELSVIANHLAADLTTADRLAGAIDDEGSVAVQTDLQERVVGQTYLISLERVDDNRTAIVLATDDPDVSVTAVVRTTREVETGRFHGGDLTISSGGSVLGVDDD